MSPRFAKVHTFTSSPIRIKNQAIAASPSPAARASTVLEAALFWVPDSSQFEPAVRRDDGIGSPQRVSPGRSGSATGQDSVERTTFLRATQPQAAQIFESLPAISLMVL